MRKHRTTPYRRGAAFENRVRDWLEQRGYYVVRAAGSKGPFDLVAWANKYPPGSPRWQRLLIQCRRRATCSPEDRCRMIDAERGLWAMIYVVRPSGRQLLARSVDGWEKASWRPLEEVS